MKIRLLFVFFFLLTVSISNSQTKMSEKVKSDLITLFEHCANNNYERAAGYLVYRGIDSLRKWIDVYDYTNENEKREIQDICLEIKSILEYGGEFSFIQFKTERESEGEWYIWQVEFQKGEAKKVYFACLKIKGKYALGDIDM